MLLKQAVVIGALWALALGNSADAQQTLSGQPAVVRVEGLERVVDALARVERKLDQLLSSRWEYRLVRHNRLNETFSTDAVAELSASLGRDGWELVGATDEGGFIFRRRVLSR